MVLDSRIQRVKDWYAIHTWTDWQALTPADVLSVPEVGPSTLDHIRLYLAAHKVTLRDDRTPRFWLDHLKAKARVVHQMTDQDKLLVCPFVVIVDSAEQQPWTFDGIHADAVDDNRGVIVQTETGSLGRHPDGFGDYSIKGYERQVAIERKSVQDCQSTILSWGEGRDRFEQELHNLSCIQASLVIVEGTFWQVVDHQVDRRKTEHSSIRKQVMRSIIAFQQDYRVPWLFCDSRRLAEVTAFRFLERFWKKQLKAAKEAEKALASL